MPENSNSVLLNIETTCRTCLKEKSSDELRSLLFNDLISQICEVTGIQLHLKTSLPAGICNNCFEDLNIAVNFRKQVHNVESHLKELICKEESDNMTVIYKTFTVLDSGVISEDCRSSINEIITPGLVGNDEVNQDANQQDDNIYTTTDNISDTTTESANCFDGATSNTSFKAEPTRVINATLTNVIRWAESESSLPPLETEKIELNHAKSAKTDASSRLENKSQNEDTKPPKNVNFKCDLCLMSFIYEFTYKKHFLKHGTPLGCELCLLIFYDSDAYLLHIKNVHPHYKPFACPNCEERFFTFATLKKHNTAHTELTQNGPKRFACEVCGKKFHQPNSLTAHKKCHIGYQCDVCHKKLSCSHSLRNHLKIHNGQKKHKCDICGATFIHRFSLRAHLRTHTGEKPFACKLCKKKFSTSSYLKIHSRTHTAEKPFVCSFCNKRFVSRCALAAHEKAHTGEKKYQCDFCGWRTSRSADLRTHIRTHTGEKPYSCSQCGKSFKTASNLSAHRRTHLGIKEHVCNICDKAFGDPRTLRSHIRIHTGETPYQCHICGHRFKQSGQLSAHRKMHQIKEVPDNT